MSANRKMLLKCLILGDASVGKTSLLQRYVNNKFNGNYRTTIGADFLIKEVTVDNRYATMQLWDTAGQDRFETLGRVFYRGTNVCVLVYDITSAQSFENLDKWMKEYRDAQPSHRGDTTVFAVFGNKCDLERRRAVSQQRAEDWCRANGGIPHYFVSAREGFGIDLPFVELTRQAMAVHDEEDIQLDYTNGEKIRLEEDTRMCKSPGICCSV